jgi:flagellar biosynthetic protein FlhB
VAEEEVSEQEKTEAPSQRRLQRAREEGQFPISRELVTLGSLAAGWAGILIWGEGAARDMARQLAGILGNLDSVRLAGPTGLKLAATAGLSVSALLLAPLGAASALVLVQSGCALNRKAIGLKLGQLNPLAGFRRMLSRDASIEAGKSLLKVAVVAGLLWSVRCQFDPVAQLALQSPRYITGALSRSLVSIVESVLLFQAGVAGFDVFWVRFQHLRKLRMSQHDLREELKETDGDPKIKARLRQMRLQRAKKRMLAQVPKATVVITNPTHYAVALSYDRAKNAAPRVVAKGMDEVAARIRDMARQHGVPVVSNPPLARALFRADLDTDILPEHYQAVAEVIAYLWRLKSRFP